jgi:two-component system, OmpR family, response regulator
MVNSHILAVLGRQHLSLDVAAALGSADFTVVEASTGREGLQLATQPGVDLAIIDAMLPDLDGFEICERVRWAGLDFPIVFVSARNSVADRVRGFTLGADDYLTNPFSVEELLARLRNVLRRVDGARVDYVYQCGHLRLDDLAHRVSVAGMPVELSATEYKLVRFLLGRSNELVGRDEILEHVWGRGLARQSNILESFVCTLRKKVDTKEPRLIHTVRGLGYRMTAPQEIGSSVSLSVRSQPHRA